MSKFQTDIVLIARMPDFVQYRPTLWADIGQSRAYDGSTIAKLKASVSQRKEGDTGFDQDIAVEDAELIEDDKDFGPRMILAGTELPFHLKERKSG